jgi:hypothetical protein
MCTRSHQVPILVPPLRREDSNDEKGLTLQPPSWSGKLMDASCCAEELVAPQRREDQDGNKSKGPTLQLPAQCEERVNACGEVKMRRKAHSRGWSLEPGE